MLSWVRRQLSYANIVATMALLFAMGGSAVAAKHYLVSSTGQISPQVIKQLEAKFARHVKAGTPGLPGASGKDGASGQEGGRGPQGEPGQSGLSALSQGEQEKVKAILPYMSYVAHGVGGAPTTIISGIY